MAAYIGKKSDEHWHSDLRRAKLTGGLASRRNNATAEFATYSGVTEENIDA